MWTLNDKLPVVFGTGSVLSFLEANPVERITVVYEPLLWNVSERIILVESQGKQHAYYPSDMETKIFADKAVTAPWGSKLAFIPRSELSPGSLELFERLDQRFAGARPQSEKDGWKAGVSGVLSVALTLGVLGFLYFQLKGQLKSLKFIEPAQVHGSIDDLVGMDDIKAEVAQIKDQYRAPRGICRVRHQQALQCDVQRPGGYRQDQAGQLPGQGTGAAHPVPLRRQPGNGLRGRRLEYAQPHRGHGQAAQALHRLPRRGAGSVHEARRPPQVRRRHREHAAVRAGWRAQQERSRDHLDRGQQLQQRNHADGRGHAAPLPDEGGLSHAQPGRAAGDHRPLSGPARRQGAARPRPAPSGGQ